MERLHHDLSFNVPKDARNWHSKSRQGGTLHTACARLLRRQELVHHFGARQCGDLVHRTMLLVQCKEVEEDDVIIIIIIISIIIIIIISIIRSNSRIFRIFYQQTGRQTTCFSCNIYQSTRKLWDLKAGWRLPIQVLQMSASTAWMPGIKYVLRFLKNLQDLYEPAAERWKPSLSAPRFDRLHCCQRRPPHLKSWSCWAIRNHVNVALQYTGPGSKFKCIVLDRTIQSVRPN